MKVTKQTHYNKVLAQRALTMGALVSLIKDERTKRKIESFRTSGSPPCPAGVPD